MPSETKTFYQIFEVGNTLLILLEVHVNYT